jgi:hypothetical protein
MVPVSQGEDLDTLRRYCVQTGKEMAEERGLPWDSAEQAADPYMDDELTGEVV